MNFQGQSSTVNGPEQQRVFLLKQLHSIWQIIKKLLYLHDAENSAQTGTAWQVLCYRHTTVNYFAYTAVSHNSTEQNISL